MPSQLGTKIFEVPLTNLCPNTTLKFSIWLINLMSPNHPMVLSGATNIEYPNLIMRIVDASNVVLATYTSGNIPTDGQWHEHFVLFNNGNNSALTLEIINNCSGTGYGNDVAMDDITVRPCVPITNIIPLLDTAFCESKILNFNTTISSGVYSAPYYQWQVSTNQGANWNNIGLPTSVSNITYNFQANPTLTDYWLRCIVTPTQSGNNAFCRAVSDTTKVIIDSTTVTLPSINDTTICVLDTITVGSNINGVNFLWSTGAITPEIKIGTAGVYWLRISNAAGCFATDTFVVSLKNAGIIDLGNDTTLCEGIMLTLNATTPNASSYAWGDGTNSAQINISTSGKYWVMAKIDDCWATDTINVIFVPKPEFSLGDQINICKNATVTLEPDKHFDLDYSWSNGSKNRTLRIDSSGVYWLTIKNPPNCEFTDTVIVSQIECVCEAMIPNAFSPNGDGKNEIFIPVLSSDCPIGMYTIAIYNRWGQSIFTSNQPHYGWDGTFKGKTADLGVYFYHLRYKNLATGGMHEYSGEVNLIR